VHFIFIEGGLMNGEACPDETLYTIASSDGTSPVMRKEQLKPANHDVKDAIETAAPVILKRKTSATSAALAMFSSAFLPPCTPLDPFV
jgi:hypothetical protein